MSGEAARLASEILTNPLRVEVTPPATTVDRIDQSVYHIDAREKPVFLADILSDPAYS